MASMYFTDFQQPAVPASWLNDVNNLVYSGLPPSTAVVGGCVSVLNIAALEALPVPSGVVIVFTQGFSSIGDGGQGGFGWNSTDISTPNGATIVACTANGALPGRWNNLF